MALAEVTMRVCVLGYASTALLEVLAGCWVSILLFRRPIMAVMSLIYATKRGHSRQDVVKLSAELKGELALLIVLAPLAVTDMRADVADHIYESDASNWGTAHVRGAVPEAIYDELLRHSCARGSWNRLLAPSQQWLYAHGLLPDVQQLPGGDPQETSPIWDAVAQSVHFVDRGRAKYKGKFKGR